MSEQEKAKLIEEHLPTVEAVIDEYRAQGKELTRQEAEKVRERLRADLTVGHVDAMENVLGDDALDAVAGGGCIGGVPTPTATPPRGQRRPDHTRSDRYRPPTVVSGVAGTVGSYRQALERIVRSDHSSTIHVQLPSYRDCELKNTILALRGMAADPERVHIAVCCQGDDPETLKWLDAVPDLTYRYYTEADAPGTCRARYDCNRMLGDEDYVLHLDSHMRFAKHWDLMLLDQLARCRDERAILTGYCQGYNEYLTEPWDAEVFTDRALCAAIIQTAGGYYGQGITPFLRAVHRWDTGGEPTPGAMVSAHFLFAPARLDREVPFDPCMYFVGDELPMALRYFTRGWNVYHPGVCCVWHLYDRANVLKQHGLPFAWPDSTEPRRLLKLWVEKQRILKLYGMEDNDQDLTGFDLGGVRTLREFEDYAGIRFKTREIAPWALNGEYGLYGKSSGGVPDADDLTPLLDSD